uniref:Uncharacterized protein n=1 Tax=Serratia marcescens TaxID=615 RepID=A0A4P3AGA8_SERMA|nr:TPA_exp: hypothetical protein [Serratia marcescens]
MIEPICHFSQKKKIYRKTVHPIHLFILSFYFNALMGV